MTNITIINGAIKNNEVVRVIVTYGKANAFVESIFVKGDAFEQFVKETEERIAKRGWTKDVNITENCPYRVTVWNGEGHYGEIFCYTKEGRTYDVKVN